MSARKPKRQAKAQPKTVRKVIKVYPDNQIIQVPKEYPCDLDAANLAFEEAIGILDLLSDLSFKDGPPASLSSVLLTALSAVWRAKDAIFGERMVQS